MSEIDGFTTREEQLIDRFIAYPTFMHGTALRQLPYLSQSAFRAWHILEWVKAKLLEGYTDQSELYDSIQWMEGNEAEVEDIAEGMELSVATGDYRLATPTLYSDPSESQCQSESQPESCDRLPHESESHSSFGS